MDFSWLSEGQQTDVGSYPRYDMSQLRISYIYWHERNTRINAPVCIKQDIRVCSDVGNGIDLIHCQ